MTGPVILLFEFVINSSIRSDISNISAPSQTLEVLPADYDAEVASIFQQPPPPCLMPINDADDAATDIDGFVTPVLVDDMELEHFSPVDPDNPVDNEDRFFTPLNFGLDDDNDDVTVRGDSPPQLGDIDIDELG
jgi:hypothetical protein